MIGQFEARPPFVQFKMVPMPDQEASREAGRAMTKDVAMAYISQPGSKDRFEVKADKWLESIKRKHMEGASDAYPLEWVQHFNAAYTNWKNGVTSVVPEGETSLRQVAFVTPSEAENYAAMNIHTVEAAAAMTEDAIRAAGMGGRAFRDKCRAWLDSANDKGRVAEEISHLKSQLEDRNNVISTLEERLKALEAAMPKRGRPRKDEELEAA